MAQAWWTNVHGLNGFLVKAFFGFDYNCFFFIFYFFLIIIVRINAFLGKSYSGIVGVSVELSFRWNFKKSIDDIKKAERKRNQTPTRMMPRLQQLDK